MENREQKETPKLTWMYKPKGMRLKETSNLGRESKKCRERCRDIEARRKTNQREDMRTNRGRSRRRENDEDKEHTEPKGDQESRKNVAGTNQGGLDDQPVFSTTLRGE